MRQFTGALVHQIRSRGKLNGPILKMKKLVLGVNATKEVLESRAMNLGVTPKCQLPMEVDSPAKKKCFSYSNDNFGAVLT